jgi:hypothetical protein
MPSTTNSTAYSNAREPKRVVGANIIPITDTVPTTELGEAGDRRRIARISHGLELVALFLQHGDGDTGGTAFDADIVLHDDDGDTILYNAGTAFSAANATGVHVALATDGIRVNAAADDASIDFLVNVAATTAQALTLEGYILARG